METDTHTQTDGQIDRQTDTQTDRQTDTQTDRQTDTQTKYSNPRCTCAPRVNYNYACITHRYNNIHVYRLPLKFAYCALYVCACGINFYIFVFEWCSYNLQVFLKCIPNTHKQQNSCINKDVGIRLSMISCLSLGIFLFSFFFMK